MCREPASSADSEKSSQIRFCGMCGRPLEPGQAKCRYCDGTKEHPEQNRAKTGNSKLAIIITAAAICVLAVGLLLSSAHKNGIGQGQTADDVFIGQPDTEEQIVDVKQLYYDFFGRTYGWDNEKDAPYIPAYSNKYNVFLADITHDGEDEMIVVDNTKDYEGIELVIYSCSGGSVDKIYTDSSAMGPRGKTFGLSSDNGLTYFVVCSDAMDMAGGEIYYRVFSLTASGNADILNENSYAVTLNPDNYDEVGEEYYVVLDEMKALKDRSTILFDCDEGYVRQSDPLEILS
jgi:hypothetical protein